MSQPEPPSRLAFDDVVIDTAGRRLWRGGVEQSLEPKAFGVLALLAGAPGRAFARDEILDAVWGHRHVTPGVLNRVMTLLRHALGEEANAPRYLHTVHGVGYRFDLPAAAAAVPAATSTEPESASRPASTPMPGEAPSMPPAVPVHRFPRAAWVAIPLLAALGFAGWKWWPHDAPVAGDATPAIPARATVPPTLVVLPLRAVGVDHDEGVLAQGLSEELTTRLSRIKGLSMISATSATIAQARQFDSAQLAERLKATHAIEGSLRETDRELRINLRLVELPSGKLVWTQAYDRKPTDVFSVQGEIAQDVATALALQPAAIITADQRSIDPLLLRRVHEARAILRGSADANGRDPEAMMRALVAEHPDYAPAHGFLSVMLYVKHGRDPAALREARREAELAQRLDPDEPESCYTLATLAALDTDWERAIAMFRKSAQLAPSDPAFPGIYGRAMAGLGYLDEGLREAAFGTAHDPLSAMALSTQAMLLDAAGRHDEARRQYEDFAAAAPERAGSVSWSRWFNAFWRHDDAGMQAAMDTMPQGNWTASYRAVTAALHDATRWPQAWAEIEASERRARAQHVDGPGVNFLRLSLPNPDYVQSLAVMDDSLRNNWGNYHLMIWMPEYRAARQSPAFQDYLKRNRILDYWRAHGFPPQCHPQGDGAVCA